MEETLDKNVLIEELRTLKEEKMNRQERLDTLNKELENTKENEEKEYDE